MTLACVLVAICLLCGAGLRTRFTLFDRIYVPPSVIAGFIGLGVLQMFARIDLGEPNAVGNAAETLRGWPGTLIAVVFSGMLLPRATMPWKQSANAAGREALMVWIIVLGQTAIGLLATWLLIKPFYDLPSSFGMLLETGFAGGHGTAAAMGQVFASPQVGLPEGLDLGLLMATIGLVYGTLSGIVWINLAARWGWVEKKQVSPIKATEELPTSYQLQRDHFSRGLDPLLMQAIWLALAFAIGWGLQEAVSLISLKVDGTFAAEESTTDLLKQKVSYKAIFGSFPLFIYTMIGGLIIRKLLKLIDAGHLIDEIGIARWTSIAMDLLVVGAIATLNLNAVIELVIPFSILVTMGMIWTGFCLMVLSKRILPSTHWFELGLINYGMSTGTTATGFVLLRIVDPDLKTDAAKDYALAAPLTAPFIGGGMFTIGLPLLVLERVPVAVSSLVLTATVIVLTLIAISIGKQR